MSSRTTRHVRALNTPKIPPEREGYGILERERGTVPETVSYVLMVDSMDGRIGTSNITLYSNT